MWKSFSISVVLFFAFHLCAQSPKTGDPEPGRIVTLENAWNQAVQQKDISALNLLLATDLTYIDYDGTLMDKPAYLLSIKSTTLAPARVVSESMQVRITGEVGVVIGVYRETGVKDGKPYSLRERFTDTWAHHGASWVCVASQSTLISNQNAASAR